VALVSEVRILLIRLIVVDPENAARATNPPGSRSTVAP
jgi:hypothetical protein